MLGDLEIEGDRAQAKMGKHDKNKIEEIDISGSPVHFQIENWLERVQGHSDTMRLSTREGIIYLDGHAYLMKNGTEFSGDHLTYELQLIKLQKEFQSE